MKNLQDQKQLKNSSVVANSLMNRERVFKGGNSYEKELSFGIEDFLANCIESRKSAKWLDICCGRGNALIEAAEIFKGKNLEIVGIDLVGMFDENPENNLSLKLIESSFEDFEILDKFDLITCVHGLHYIGDKLAFIQKSVSNLKPNGIFLANLDPDNFKFQNGESAGRKIIKNLRSRGLEYDSKKHLLKCVGNKDLDFEFEFEYLGADDNAGANYTKQAVVNSIYV